jgi:hypothetical protein
MIHCFWNLISLPQVRESLMELDSIRADVQQNLAVMPRSYGQARNPTLPIALYDLVCDLRRISPAVSTMIASLIMN